MKSVTAKDERPPFVSVIIPVFNDADRLRRCLRALEEQTYPEDRYEVLVVDNGSDEDLGSVVSCFGQTRFAREDRPGSYAARNRGLSSAKGEVLAFTDSDCIPAPDWIERGAASLPGLPDYGLAAGRVSVFPEDPDHPTAVELYEVVTAFPQKQYVESTRFGVTANLFTHRSVFERVGDFDGGLRSGGDREWGRRMHARGYAQVYAGDALVYHPARRTFEQLRAKILRVTGGNHAMRRAELKGGFLGFEKEFFLSMIPPIRSAGRILRDGRLPRLRDRIKVVLILFFVRYLHVGERLRLRLLAGRKA